MDVGHLFQAIPDELAEEQLEALLTHGSVTIERILSKGQASPKSGWFDQARHEWVAVLKGEAVLRFEEGSRMVHLTEGMHINIPAHCRHRVEWTPEDRVTLWLAVFY